MAHIQTIKHLSGGHVPWIPFLVDLILEIEVKLVGATLKDRYSRKCMMKHEEMKRSAQVKPPKRHHKWQCISPATTLGRVVLVLLPDHQDM